MLLEAKLQKTFFVIQRASKGQLTHNAIALRDTRFLPVAVLIQHCPA